MLANSGATAHIDDGATLFDIEKPPPVTLADKFLIPPFSVIDRRAGEWQDRRRRWLSLGIESELGRADGLTFSGAVRDVDAFRRREGKRAGEVVDRGTSVFDPALCELTYRWFSAPGARVLDPFAGGSVRGVVASTLARWYTGIELRPEQVAANRAQAHLGSDIAPQWIEGDSSDLPTILGPGDEFDLVFSCPPYADLEVYSDDPRDLSAMPYEDFMRSYRAIIRASVEALRRDRFAAWVISDVRDNRGLYRGLVAETVSAFTDAGAALYNEGILVDPVASASARAERPFVSTRKMARTHQHLLVFVKGDPRKAAAYARGEA